jgi:spore germination cell wall hydrolase CwlJ-like protein
VYTDLRRSLRIYWNRSDKGAWIFAVTVVVILALLAYALAAVFESQDDRNNRTRELHTQNLNCLARNIYFEARGEPLAGQYAVAEVTMNRRASRFFRRTVCEVVYEKSAFSWTELRPLPEPSGPEWRRAWRVAEAVYYQRYTPQLQGATFYHATYIRPDWAKDKQRVAKIGRHVFYR